MAELKTQLTGASVAQFISAIPDHVRRGDCRTLASLMRRATGARAEMWGPSIVGFGRYHYCSDSGREGDWFLAGFSPRKQDLTVYVIGGFNQSAALLARLGRHRKSGGGCLYLKRLAEVDLSVLEQIVANSAATLRAIEARAAKEAKPRVVAKAEVKSDSKKGAKPVARSRPSPKAKSPAKPARRGR